MMCNWSTPLGPPAVARRARARLTVEGLEARCVPVATVYVDDSWAGTTPGTDPDGAGPATAFGVDSFATIQDGVNAVDAGGTVEVADGTYAESVLVFKSATLRGEQAGVDARTRTGVPESVVDDTANSGRTPFNVTASNVVIDGFTVQGTTNANQFGSGIVLGPGTAGSEVRNNIVQNNIIGLLLANNSATNPTVIERNLFRDNNRPGPAAGHAIYTDEFVAGGLLTNVLIDSNTFTGNTTASINLASGTPGSQSDITIANNTVSGGVVRATNASDLTVTRNTLTAAVGLSLTAVTNSAVTQNTIRNSLSLTASVRLLGGVANLRVEENFIEDGQGVGVRLTAGLAGANSNVTLFNNSIEGHPGRELEVLPGAHTGTLQATGNWWGTALAAGVAAEISGDVNYIPFLTSGADTSATPGFQGTFAVAPGEGNVTVAVRNQVLTLTGDDLDNLIQIEQGSAPGSYVVTGLAGTQVNGRSGSFEFSGATKGVQALLNAGDDVLIFDGSLVPIVAPGDIFVGTGYGHDLTELRGVTSGNVDVTSNLGGGDRVQVFASTFRTLDVSLAAGRATGILLDGVMIQVRAGLITGDAGDTVRVMDSVFNGTLSVRGRGGDDEVRIEGTHSVGAVQVLTGLREDLIVLSNSTFDASVLLDGGPNPEDALDAGSPRTASPVPNSKGNRFAVTPTIRRIEIFLS